ncbi:MAG: hypothetical protein ABSE49_25480 [Polyangiaceae bacterium]|jgi:hypothetical protein
MVTRRVARGLVVLGVLAACTPTFSDTTSIVGASRLLAVQAVPAEAAPGGAFTMTALYVGPDGAQDPSGIDWAICLLQKPLGDPDPIATACFVDASSGLTSLGAGGSVSGSVPANACELFGPESPPPAPGQPAARPTDPDATGGFYLPVSIDSDGGQWSAALERISCQPSGVTQAVLTAFSNGYVPNQNPTIASLASVDADGGVVSIAPDAPGAGPALTVSAGQTLSLEVTWPECPSTPAACGGAETYLLIDSTTKQVDSARESIVASWYATAGTFALDRVGRDGTDMTTSADNGWTAPPTPGPVHLWVVLRDARGGVGWGSYTVTVNP